jgi:hypothetical protein
MMICKILVNGLSIAEVLRLIAESIIAVAVVAMRTIAVDTTISAALPVVLLLPLRPLLTGIMLFLLAIEPSSVNASCGLDII